MPAQGIVQDPLNGLLCVTNLTFRHLLAAEADVEGTEKAIKAMPLAVIAVLQPIVVDAGKTIDLKVQGKQLTGDATWTDLVTFTQVTASSKAIQRKEITTPMKIYRTVHTVAGTAFGDGNPDPQEYVVFDCYLVGTNCKNAPIVQVA